MQASGASVETLVASVSISTPSIISPSNSITMGDDDAFTIGRPAHTSGAGEDFIISGQDGAPGGNGGDLVLQAGSHDGGTTHGQVQLAGASGAPVVSVTDTLVLVEQPLTIQLSAELLNAGTAGIDAGSATIQTTGAVEAGTVTATTSITSDTVVISSASGSVTTPSLLGTDRGDGSTYVIEVGDDNAFTLTRPDHTSGQGQPFTIRGQKGSTDANGGDLVIRPGAAGPGAASCAAKHVDECAALAVDDCVSDGRCLFNDQGNTDPADDACEAADLASCDAQSANGPTACTAAGECVYSSGDGVVQLSGAAGGPVVEVSSNMVTVSQPLSTQSITSTGSITTTGTVTADTVTASTSVTTPTLQATTAVTTPLLLSTDDVISLGDDDAFTLKRPQHTSGGGTSLTIQGQNAASGSSGNGGDVVIQAGAGDSAATCTGTATDAGAYPSCATAFSDAGADEHTDCPTGCEYNSGNGVIEIRNGAGDVVMTIKDDEVNMGANVLLSTQAIDAGANDITTAGLVSAGTLTATTSLTAASLIVACPAGADCSGAPTAAATIPLLLSNQQIGGADVMFLGDDDDFILQRADSTSGSGTAFEIQGQSGAPAACVETAVLNNQPSVSTDAEACAAVTALSNSAACDLESACTYTVYSGGDVCYVLDRQGLVASVRTGTLLLAPRLLLCWSLAWKQQMSKSSRMPTRALRWRWDRATQLQIADS
jgi:hypothetical protein